MDRKKPDFVGPGGGLKFDLPFDVNFKLPPKVRGLLAAGLIVLVAVGVLYSFLLEYVRPNEYGVKEVKVGMNRGIQDEWYSPGLAFVIPRIHIMYRLPRTVQVLELTNVTGRSQQTAARSSSVAVEDAAKIQTSDGFYVDVDVSILYRIIDPVKVVRELGTARQFLSDGILPKAEPVLKQTLGQLTTEEFYNSPVRVAKAEEARDLLDKEMRPKGIQVDHVLVRYFKYSDRIQQNIDDKKLQDQLVFTNQSKKAAAEEQQLLNRVLMEGEMRVAVTIQEGDAYRVKKEAEKELYVRRQEAEADLLIQLAEAERSRLRNDAMQVQGSDRMVGLRMAEVLQGLEFIVVPTGGENSLNPMNLEGLLEMFGVQDYGPGAASAPAAPLRLSPPPQLKLNPLPVKPPPPPPEEEGAEEAAASNDEEVDQ